MSDRIFDAIEKVAIAPDIPVADKVKLIDELRKGMPAIMTAGRCVTSSWA